jgi:porin
LFAQTASLLAAETTAPAASQPATAPAPAGEPAKAPLADFVTSKRLTGDWGGVRTELEKMGISLSLASQTQYMINMHGGKEVRNGNDFAGSYDLSLEVDFGKMKLIPGGSFFIRGKGTYGGEANDFDSEKVGGLFKTDFDAGPEEPIFVDKWWWRQRLLDDRLEFRLGRLSTSKDLFDVSDVAGNEDEQFLNQALVVNPAIAHRIGLGAYAVVWPTDWLYVKGAVIDADSRPRRTGFDTAFHGEDRGLAMWEFGFTPKFSTAKGKLPGKYLVGSWYNPAKRQYYGSKPPRYCNTDVGFYTLAEQMLWKENDKPGDKQGFWLSGRYGYAHGDVNKIEHFWSVATLYTGPIPTRDADTMGFGVAQGILSEDYRQYSNPLADRETVYELYYAYRITGWCTISPDLQYITNTGGNSNGPDTTVAGIRLKVNF